MSASNSRKVLPSSKDLWLKSNSSSAEPVGKCDKPNYSVISSRNAVAAMEKLSTALLSSTSQSSLSMSVAASGSLINGHDERDFEDKKVSHMKQKRRITAAANDNVQKREELRWMREQGRKRGGIKIEPRELKRWGEADGLRKDCGQFWQLLRLARRF